MQTIFRQYIFLVYTLTSLIVIFLLFVSASFAVSEKVQQLQEEGKMCISDYTRIQEEFLGTISNKNNTLTDLMVKNQDTGAEKWNLVEYYCNTWLHTFPQNWGSKLDNMKYRCVDSNQMRFDPRQSMFMYGLCVAYDEANKTRTDYSYKERSSIFEVEYIVPFSNNKEQNIDKSVVTNIQKYIPEEVAADLLGERRELDSQEDDCDPTKGMANCWMWYPTSNILRNVFWAYFDLKKAAIDGVNHGKKPADIDLAVQDLSRALFNQEEAESGICLDTSKTFLSKTDAPSNESQSYCGHPQTYAFVYNQIESALLDVERVTKLNPDPIYEDPCESVRGNLLACAMSVLPDEFGDEIDDKPLLHDWEERAWRNLIANELFFAHMWADFFEMQLLSNTRYQWDDESSNLEDKIKRSRLEILWLRQHLDMIEDASDRMITLLAQYRTMYAMCIALSAQQEDIDALHKPLNKMYAPTHQLYYETKNAQQKDGV